MKLLMDEIAETAGYCCTYNMLVNNKKISEAALARHLGVARSSLQFHKKKKATGVLTRCPKCPKSIPEPRPVRLRTASGAGKS